MGEKVNFIQELFENGQTGEQVPGVTIIVDGQFRKVLDILIERNPHYNSYADVLHDALFTGLEQLRREIR